jgi:GDPmannose 4,6-dehydratase
MKEHLWNYFVRLARMSKIKKALITGITGQDGSYLAEFLLKLGYEVHGIKRRSSLLNTTRIDHIYEDPSLQKESRRFVLHYGDLSDSTNIIRIIQEVKPHEIYNLGAMSHVKVSFEMPEYAADIDGIGTLRILEAVRLLGMQDTVRIYQASTSELYGLVQEIPQTEKTPFYPRSPYACAKLYGYWITVNYREAYNMYACNGILFNHGSCRRGETFVERKISLGVARIALGKQTKLLLGNLDAKRDWGHAKDYVRGMWLMLQQDKPQDYVLSTGVTTSVRDFAKMAFEVIGVTLSFSGTGMDESAEISSVTAEATVKYPNLKVGQCVISIDERYFRPTEVDLLLGDSSKARTELGWEPEYDLKKLCHEMVTEDLRFSAKNSETC